MKKNILLVPSLLALSFVATTPLLGMEIDKPIQYNKKPTSQGKNRKQRRQEAKNQQKKAKNRQTKINQLQQQLAKEQKQQEAYQARQDKFEQMRQQVTDEIIIQDKKDHSIRFHNLLQDLQSSQIFQQKSQLNNIAEVVENPLYNPEAQTASNLILSETEVITLPLPERINNNNNNNNTEVTALTLPENTHNNDNTNNKLVDLGQSIMFPAEAKPLSSWQKLRYAVKHTFTPYQLVEETIAALENNEFDVNDAGDFGRLYNAIEIATYDKDIKSLDRISTLCYQNYPTTIRIPDEVAQPAAQLLNNHYAKEMTLTNDLLQDKDEERMQQLNKETAICIAAINNIIHTYQQNIGFANGSYNAVLDLQNKYATDLRRNVSTFALLNRSIRPEINNSLHNNKLQTPNNIHAHTMSVSAQQLNSILTTTNNVATTKQVQKKYIQNLINNK